MLRLAVDENFNNDIIRGIARRSPALDIRRVQDAGLRKADDRSVLEWAASEARVLLTHDGATMPQIAFELVAAGLPMSGIIHIHARTSVAIAIDEICLIAECGVPDDCANRVIYVSRS
jgi:hypothetical protein